MAPSVRSSPTSPAGGSGASGVGSYGSRGACRNHRRLRRYERSEPNYAIVNDTAHDYSIVQYYITRDEQERQLAALGFVLLECRDLAGNEVPAGAAAGHTPEMHYVGRVTDGDGGGDGDTVAPASAVTR